MVVEACKIMRLLPAAAPPPHADFVVIHVLFLLGCQQGGVAREGCGGDRAARPQRRRWVEAEDGGCEWWVVVVESWGWVVQRWVVLGGRAGIA